MKRQVKNNVYWIGKIDWELEEFHGSDYSISVDGYCMETAQQRVCRKS